MEFILHPRFQCFHFLLLQLPSCLNQPSCMWSLSGGFIVNSRSNICMSGPMRCFKSLRFEKTCFHHQKAQMEESVSEPVGVRGTYKDQWNEKRKICNCDRCCSTAGVKPGWGYVRWRRQLHTDCYRSVRKHPHTLSCHLSVCSEALSHFLCFTSISGRTRRSAAALWCTLLIPFCINIWTGFNTAATVWVQSHPSTPHITPEVKLRRGSMATVNKRRKMIDRLWL